ncbi:hypothetical protein niasHS_013815 [Heterodera schachtii]|uniref:Uncharacterized protein n=1 Tax=Heterodera schachtii TaxID=97005 RepID=A0ABD2IL44_HETSC
MLLRQLLLFFVSSFLFGHSFGGLCGSKPSKIGRSNSLPHRRASATPPTQMRRANSTPKKRRNPSKNRVNSAEHPPALSRHPSGRKQCFDDTVYSLNNQSFLKRQSSSKGRKSDAKEPSQKRHSLKSQMMLDRINDHQERQSAGYRNSYGSDSSYRTSYGFDGTPTSSGTFDNGTPSSLGAYERKIKKQNLKKKMESEQQDRMDQLWEPSNQDKITHIPWDEDQRNKAWRERWNDNQFEYFN